jgi:hypothetical protein
MATPGAGGSVVGVGVGLGDGDGDTVADGGGVVRGAVVRGGAGVDALLLGAGVVGDAVAVALGVYRVVSGGAPPVGRSVGTAVADELVDEPDPVGDCTASVGAGSPGVSGCGEDDDVGRSATVAPTNASTTTTAPAAAPISASRRRRPDPAGSNTYRSRGVDSPCPRSVDIRSRTRARPSARPSLIRSPTPGAATGVRPPKPVGLSGPVRGYHALPTRQSPRDDADQAPAGSVSSRLSTRTCKLLRCCSAARSARCNPSSR